MKNWFLWFKPAWTAQSANPSSIIWFKKPDEQYLHKEEVTPRTARALLIIKKHYLLKMYPVFVCVTCCKMSKIYFTKLDRNTK